MPRCNVGEGELENKRFRALRLSEHRARQRSAQLFPLRDSCERVSGSAACAFHLARNVLVTQHH